LVKARVVADVSNGHVCEVWGLVVILNVNVTWYTLQPDQCYMVYVTARFQTVDHVQLIINWTTGL